MLGDRPPVWASKTVIIWMLVIAALLFWIIVTGGPTWE